MITIITYTFLYFLIGGIMGKLIEESERFPHEFTLSVYMFWPISLTYLMGCVIGEAIVILFSKIKNK
jgi:hypothetical protein